MANILGAQGQWTVYEQGDADEYALRIRSEGNWLITFRMNGEMLPEKQRAIAYQISAAPEMLAALKDARSRLADLICADCKCDNTHETNGTTCCLCEYASVIAKAEGRS